MLSLFNICINPVNSKQEKKKNVYFDEIFSRNICKNKKCPYLCTRNRETYYSRQQKLFYGVMVTRQILVLKFQVRALVEQQLFIKPSVNQSFAEGFLFKGAYWGTFYCFNLFNIDLSSHFICIFF